MPGQKPSSSAQSIVAASDAGITAVGSHFQVTNAQLASEHTISRPAGANAVLLSETGGQNVRYIFDDSTTVTASKGHVVEANGFAFIMFHGDEIRLIREADGATIDGTWCTVK